MEWGSRALAEPFGLRRPGLQEEKLDRALVAGLLVEVILETPGLPPDPRVRQRLIKTRLKESLVCHLAGRVTLDRFRLLAGRLDRWFAYYYPLISPSGPEREDHQAPFAEQVLPPRPLLPENRALREDFLEDWLSRHLHLLPRRRHGKLDREGLQDFLRLTQGGWFRLKDFQHYFRMDRKTAWEYLQKLARAGLLAHNQERSSAVRYSLAPPFLRVRGGAVRPQVSQALKDMSRTLAPQVGDWLIATGGQAFWEEEWQGLLGEDRCQEVISRLRAASLLEVRLQSGRSRLLQLPAHWRQ
jgi:hypothetical protein